MSREKIERIIERAYLSSANFSPKLVSKGLEQMLKDDYNFEFPKKFDHTKCSKNRRGDEVLFVRQNPNGSIFYVSAESHGEHYSLTVSADGHYINGEHDSDLIMDE